MNLFILSSCVGGPDQFRIPVFTGEKLDSIYTTEGIGGIDVSDQGMVLFSVVGQDQVGRIFEYDPFTNTVLHKIERKDISLWGAKYSKDGFLAVGYCGSKQRCEYGENEFQIVQHSSGNLEIIRNVRSSALTLAGYDKAGRIIYEATPAWMQGMLRKLPTLYVSGGTSSKTPEKLFPLADEDFRLLNFQSLHSVDDGVMFVGSNAVKNLQPMEGPDFPTEGSRRSWADRVPYIFRIGSGLEEFRILTDTHYVFDAAPTPDLKRVAFIGHEVEKGLNGWSELRLKVMLLDDGKVRDIAGDYGRYSRVALSDNGKFMFYISSRIIG